MTLISFIYFCIARIFNNVHAFILKPDVRGGETAQQLRASSAFAEGGLKFPVSMLGGLLLPQAHHGHLIHLQISQYKHICTHLIKKE